MSVDTAEADELFELIKKIAHDLLRLVAKYKPELLEAHKTKLEYALGPYPMEQRIHNAYEVAKMYVLLRLDEIAEE